MKQIWYIERKSYRKIENGIVEQTPDAGEELKLYDKYLTAKTMFEAYKTEYTMQEKLIEEEEFPYESFSVKSKYIKGVYTIYTLRPVQLKETIYE